MILKEIKQGYKNKGIHKMQALQHFTSIYYINTCEIPGFLLKKSYLQRTQWKYYFYLSHVRISALP